MKKSLLLVLTSILFSIGLLVGCTEGEPGFEEQPDAYDETTDPTETDLDTTEDEGYFDDEMDEEEDDEV